MRTLTRQELFEAAWDRPLTKVAAELGVTSTALRKTCDRHLIPVPRRGYLAAVASGKVFRRPKLKPIKDGRLEQILIRGATSAMTAAMVIRKARKAPPAEVTPKDTLLEEAAPVAPQREVLHVVVPTRLKSPHRLVAAWIDDDRRMRESWGRLGGREVSEQEVFINGRRQLLLDALFKSLEQRGHKVETDRRLGYRGQLRIGRGTDLNGAKYSKGRIDMAVLFDWERERYLAYECKRLCVRTAGGRASLATRYVADGMMRFITSNMPRICRSGACWATSWTATWRSRDSKFRPR